MPVQALEVLQLLNMAYWGNGTGFFCNSDTVNQILSSSYLHSFIRPNLMYHFVFLSLPPLRATQVRLVAAGEEAEVAAPAVETEPGMKTMRSLPSLHLTTLSLLFFT